MKPKYLFLFLIIIFSSCEWDKWLYVPNTDYAETILIPDSLRFGLLTGDTVIFKFEDNDTIMFDTFAIELVSLMEVTEEPYNIRDSIEVLCVDYFDIYQNRELSVCHIYGYLTNFYYFTESNNEYDDCHCSNTATVIGDLTINDKTYINVKFCEGNGVNFYSFFANSQNGLLKYTDSLNDTYKLHQIIQK